MGCTPSQRRDMRTVERKSTKVGSLFITIDGGQFYDVAKQWREMRNPSLNVQVSNQVFSTGPISKISEDYHSKETYQYFINSQYKGNGRFIEIQLLDHVGGHVRAFGTMDLDSIIEKPKYKHHQKVILHHNKNPIGYIMVLAEFSDEHYTKMSFRFENSILRKKSSFLGTPEVKVRVTVGEEVLETYKKADKKEVLLSWSDTVLEFLVPSSIKEGLIELYDDKKFIGSHFLNMQELINKNEGDEILYPSRELFNQKQNVGTISFSVISGEKGMFAQLTEKVRSTLVLNKSQHQIEQD